MKNTITINGKELKVKNTIRAMFIYEQITNKPFKIETLLDNYVYFYSILLANNGDDILEWEDFIDALDNDPKIYLQLNQILLSSNKIDELLNSAGQDTQSDKKKS